MLGSAWLGLARLGSAWLGLAWLGSAWLGLARLGLARLGLAWLGSATQAMTAAWQGAKTVETLWDEQRCWLEEKRQLTGESVGLA